MGARTEVSGGVGGVGVGGVGGGWQRGEAGAGRLALKQRPADFVRRFDSCPR